MRPEFKEFPKIPRFSREIIITEKIDGVNACICITEDLEIYAGSRTQWIDTKNDNYGFAKWIEDNKQELLKLGTGLHFGEWWGSGIRKGYGLKNGEKRFSLFNTSRWKDDSIRPTCCHVVPELYRGDFEIMSIACELDKLRLMGSIASPGFMKPEGIIIYHVAGNLSFKKTLLNDEKPKSQ